MIASLRRSEYRRIREASAGPLVSIVTPSLNQCRFLGETIGSVAAQRYPNVEHVIVDGGSQDGSIDLLRRKAADHNIVWSARPDRGQSAAVNEGVRKARGDIIGWLNSDDVLVTPSVIGKIVAIFREFPSVDILYGNRIVIDGDSRLIKLQYSSPFYYQYLLLSYMTICQESVFFRKHVLIEEPLNEDLHVVMDTDLWLRLGQRFTWLYVDGFLGGQRRHPDAKTSSKALLQRWNEEKDYLRQRYGARKPRYGSGRCGRLCNQCRGALAGVYGAYWRLPVDVYCIIRRAQRRELAFPLKASPGSYARVVCRSLLPSLK